MLTICCLEEGAWLQTTWFLALGSFKGEQNVDVQAAAGEKAVPRPRQSAGEPAVRGP